MPERAQVNSVEALDAFRAKLIVFISKARAGVDEVIDEIQRTQSWLENEQRTYWDRELRRRNRELDEAEQELFSAKISRIRTQSAAQVLAVERAKRSVRAAEAKRDAVKKWTREFESRAEPLGKQVDQLLTFLTTDLGKGVAYLGSTVKLLQDYALVAPQSDQLAPGLPTSRGGSIPGSGDSESDLRPSPQPSEAA